MKDKIFLLQTTNNGLLELEANVVANLCAAENRWNERSPHDDGSRYVAVNASIDEVANIGTDTLNNAVPVGSVEFCNAVAKAQGAGAIRAVNIPPELRNWRYTCRKVTVCGNFEELKGFVHDGKYFVKPADTPKRFEAIEYDGSSYALNYIRQAGGPYFISESIRNEILSEWRVFFFKGRIVDIRPYSINSWIMPKKRRVEEMLQDWKTNVPPAGTLDVAVVENGQSHFTTIIEAHPLIACGLYGCEDPALLRMLRQAWAWHRKESSK